MATTNYLITNLIMRVNTDDNQFVPAINQSSKTISSFNLLNTRYTGSGTDTFSTTWSIAGQAASLPNINTLPINLIKY